MHGSSIGQAVYLRKPQQPDSDGLSGCWIGGEPTLPADIEWPYYEVHDGTSIPMHFLAQIDLGEVPLVFATGSINRWTSRHHASWRLSQGT